MIENNGTTPEPAQAPVPVTFESLDSALTKIAELEREVNHLRESREFYIRMHSDATDTIEKARKLFEEILAGDMDAEGTFEEFREPFELLGVSLEREVEVEVTVTFRGTMTLPFNVDPEDLSSSYDWSAELEHNYHASDLEAVDTDVRER